MALGFGFDLMSQAVRQRPWTPRFLFGNGEQGAWYDPSDFATLYQDSAGTTPVTALGQPVGLMQDKSGNGNHASQATSAARPTVQARVNLLERTEDWVAQPPWFAQSATRTANQTAAPNGTLTADRISQSSGSSPTVFCGFTAISGVTYTFSFYAKADTVNYVKPRFSGPGVTVETDTINLSNGTSSGGASIQDSGNGWYRVAITTTATSTDTVYVSADIPNSSGLWGGSTVYTGNESIYVWGAQLEQNSTATTYQRVTTATDYADIGLPRYLEFDGVDDFIQSNAGVFGTETEFSTFVGGKNDTSTASALLAMSDGAYTASSERMLHVLPSNAAPTTGVRFFLSDGSANTELINGTADTSPTVLAGIYDGSNVFQRINGQEYSSATVITSVSMTEEIDMGAVDNGGVLAFLLDGRIYQVIVRNADTTGNLLDQTERFVARKTGVTL